MTTKAAHTAPTAGPWSFDGKYVYDSSERPLVRLHPNNFPTPESEANARLIAASPRLYEELFRALAVIRNPQAFDIDGVCDDIAQALQMAVPK